MKGEGGGWIEGWIEGWIGRWVVWRLVYTLMSDVQLPMFVCVNVTVGEMNNRRV